MRGIMGRHRLGRARRLGAVAAVAVVAAGLLVSTPGMASAVPPSRSGGPRPLPRTGHVAAVASHFAAPKDRTTPYRPTATTWPSTASTTLAVSPPGPGARAGMTARAAGTPLWARAKSDHAGGYTGPTAVGVRVFDH